MDVTAKAAAFLKNMWRGGSSAPVEKTLNLEQALRLWLSNVELKGTVKDPFRQSAWVYACITTIANKVSAVPFILASRAGGDVQLIPDTHPAARTFSTPNEMMVSVEFRQAIVINLLRHGSAPILLERNPDGTLGMWPCDPKRARPVQDKNTGELLGWEITGKRGVTYFDRSEVVFLRGLDPNDPLLGIAPMEPARAAVEQNINSAVYNNSLLDNGSVPPGFIITPKEISFDEFKRIKEEWDKGHKGSNNAGKIGWLFGGMEFKPASFSPKDMMLDVLSKSSREEILAAFGVPPAEVGIFEFANYANSREQSKKLWGNRILPLLVYIEEALDARLFRVYFPDVHGFFDITAVEDLSSTLSEKLTAAQGFFNMGVPFADINEALELPFDVSGQPHLQQGWLSGGLIPASEALAPPPLPAIAPPQPSSASPKTEASSSMEEKRRRAGFRASAVRAIGAGIRRLRPAVARYFEAEGAAVGAAVQKHYGRLFDAHGKAVSIAVAGWKKLDRSGWSKERQVKEWNAHCEKTLKDFSSDVADLIFVVDEATGNLIATTRAETERMLALGAQLTAASAASSFIIGDAVVASLLDGRANLLSGVADETFLKIRQTLQDAIRDGVGVQEASRRIRELYDGFESARAQLIAQTEMGYAFNTGAHEFYVEEEFDREWIDSGDADVRESHRIGGEVRGPEEKFSNGLLYPGEQGAPVDEVAGCRCTTAPVKRARAASHLTKPSVVCQSAYMRVKRATGGIVKIRRS